MTLFYFCVRFADEERQIFFTVEVPARTLTVVTRDHFPAGTRPASDPGLG